MASNRISTPYEAEKILRDGYADMVNLGRVLLADPGTDSVMVIYPTPPMYTAGAVAKALIPIIHQAQKPVVISVMGDRLIQEAVEHLRAARIPEYRFPHHYSRG